MKNKLEYGGVEEDLSLGAIFIFMIIGMMLIFGMSFLL